MLLQNDIEAVEVVYMEVPCCFGLVQLVQLALAESGKTIPLTLTKIGIRGEVCQTTSGTEGQASDPTAHRRVAVAET